MSKPLTPEELQARFERLVLRAYIEPQRGEIRGVNVGPPRFVSVGGRPGSGMGGVLNEVQLSLPGSVVVNGTDRTLTHQNHPWIAFGTLGILCLVTEREGHTVTAETVAATTVPERERRVAEAIHSGEMEGLPVTPATRADAQEYIADRIDSSELVARARARYGLD